MKASIPANWYADEAIFAAEQERIFSRSWSFACLYSAVREHNSWVALKVAERSVTVQNFNGELRCFLNVCSHRFCEIRLEPAGNGPLRCSYHGWAYDADGLPTAIPHRPRFEGVTPECVRSLALTRYAVERCGELVFVSLGEHTLSLRDSMGSFFPEIETLSAQMGEPADASEWTIECNWKILVESTLEAYHADFVHPESFARLKAVFGDFRFDSLASSFLGRTGNDARLTRFTSCFESRTYRPEGYFHFSLFPAFLMSTSHGIVCSVQQIVPISARRCWMKSSLFHRAADAESRVTPGMMGLMRESAIAFNRQVLAEDRAICEAVQRGASQMGGAVGILSGEERRIGEFQRSYMTFMEGHALAAGA